MVTVTATSVPSITVQLLCGRQLSSRAAGRTTLSSEVGVFTISPGPTFLSSNSTRPTPSWLLAVRRAEFGWRLARLGSTVS